jgi:hypothetical protein
VRSRAFISSSHGGSLHVQPDHYAPISQTREDLSQKVCPLMGQP